MSGTDLDCSSVLNASLERQLRFPGAGRDARRQGISRIAFVFMMRISLVRSLSSFQAFCPRSNGLGQKATSCSKRRSHDVPRKTFASLISNSSISRHLRGVRSPSRPVSSSASEGGGRSKDGHVVRVGGIRVERVNKIDSAQRCSSASGSDAVDLRALVELSLR